MDGRRSRAGRHRPAPAHRSPDRGDRLGTFALTGAVVVVVAAAAALAVGSRGVAVMSSPTTITADTLAPPAPVIRRPAAGGVVAAGRPVLSGTGEPGDTVTVAVARGTAVCATVVSAGGSREGSWSCVPAVPFADGDWQLTATGTDLAGNSTPGPAVIFSVDTLAPPAARIVTPAAGSITGPPRVSGRGEAGDTITVVDGSRSTVCVTTVRADGSWRCPAPVPLPDGAASLCAYAADPAGNRSAGPWVTFTARGPAATPTPTG